MTSKGRFLVSAAAVTISTMALAAAGAGATGSSGAGGGNASGGASARPSAIINDPAGGTIRDRDDAPTLPSQGPRATSWQGTDTTHNPNDAPRMKPPIEIRGHERDNQPQPYPTNVPATKPAVSRELPPAGTVTGNKLDVSAGTGGVTSSGSEMQTAPGTAVPGTPPVVGAPSGFLQQEAAQSNQVRGGFGSSDSSVNATAGQPVNPGLDASEIDVTQRTQQLTQQPGMAVPAGSTLPPVRQPATRPVQPQQQGTRPEVPMPPAPSGNTGMGGFGTGQGTR